MGQALRKLLRIIANKRVMHKVEGLFSFEDHTVATLTRLLFILLNRCAALVLHIPWQM